MFRFSITITIRKHWHSESLSPDGFITLEICEPRVKCHKPICTSTFVYIKPKATSILMPWKVETSNSLWRFIINQQRTDLGFDWMPQDLGKRPICTHDSRCGHIRGQMRWLQCMHLIHSYCMVSKRFTKRTLKFFTKSYTATWLPFIIYVPPPTRLPQILWQTVEWRKTECLVSSLCEIVSRTLCQQIDLYFWPRRRRRGWRERNKKNWHAENVHEQMGRALYLSGRVGSGVWNYKSLTVFELFAISAWKIEISNHQPRLSRTTSTDYAYVTHNERGYSNIHCQRTYSFIILIWAEMLTFRWGTIRLFLNIQIHSSTHTTWTGQEWEWHEYVDCKCSIFVFPLLFDSPPCPCPPSAFPSALGV